jgi:hypothetical protein
MNFGGDITKRAMGLQCAARRARESDKTFERIAPMMH